MLYWLRQLSYGLCSRGRCCIGFDGPYFEARQPVSSCRARAGREMMGA
jgi:hypothetical protein